MRPAGREFTFDMAVESWKMVGECRSNERWSIVAFALLADLDAMVYAVRQRLSKLQHEILMLLNFGC